MQFKKNTENTAKVKHFTGKAESTGHYHSSLVLGTQVQ